MHSILWENHSVQMLRLISEIHNNSEFTDCVLDTRGGLIHGYKIFLAACSPYMKKMFVDHKGMKIIPFKQVSYINMKHILNFIHYGDIDIRVNDMASLIETAELLQISSLRCALLNFSETLSIKNPTKESESNRGTVCDLHCLKSDERNIEEKGAHVFPERERGMNSISQNSNLQSHPEAKGIRLSDDLSAKVNIDDQIASVSYAEKVKMEIMNDQVNCQDELMPFSFVAVSPVCVKCEELDDLESSPCNTDPLLNNSVEEYPHDSDMINVINVERENDGGSAPELMNAIVREINVSKSDVRITENAPVTEEEEVIIPESESVSIFGEMNQSFGKMSGTVEGNAVVAKDHIGVRQSDLHVSFDSDNISVNTVGNSLKSMEEVKIKFESICDITENVLEEENPLVTCHDIKSADDDGNDSILLTDDRDILKCGVNKLEYQFEKVNQPSDAVNISQGSAVSNISCGSWKTQIKHVQREEDITFVCKEDQGPLNCVQSDTDIVSDMKCNVDHDLRLRDLKSSCEMMLTSEDLFGECNKALLSHKNRLKKQAAIHTGAKPFTCATCKASFTQRGSLMRHTFTHSLVKPFKCSLCVLSFRAKSDLLMHTRTHTGELPFKCVKCEAAFNTKKDLVRHTRTHTGEKPFQCITCNASFSEMCSLVRHTRTHTGERPFKCTYCNASFTNKSTLVNHTRTHTGEKPFKCVTCNASFSVKSNLASHTRTHTGEKPFKCVACNGSFSQKSHLVSHIRIHTEEKHFKCDTCNASFSTKCSLGKHTRTHTREKPTMGKNNSH